MIHSKAYLLHLFSINFRFGAPFSGVIYVDWYMVKVVWAFQFIISNVNKSQQKTLFAIHIVYSNKEKHHFKGEIAKWTISFQQSYIKIDTHVPKYPYTDNLIVHMASFFRLIVSSWIIVVVYVFVVDKNVKCMIGKSECTIIFTIFKTHHWSMCFCFFWVFFFLLV